MLDRANYKGFVSILCERTKIGGVTEISSKAARLHSTVTLTASINQREKFSPFHCPDEVGADRDVKS